MNTTSDPVQFDTLPRPQPIPFCDWPAVPVAFSGTGLGGFEPVVEGVDADHKRFMEEVETARKEAGLPPLPAEGDRGPDVEKQLLEAVNAARARGKLQPLTTLPPEARAALGLPAPPATAMRDQVLETVNAMRAGLGLRKVSADELPTKLRSGDVEKLLEEALALSHGGPVDNPLVADAKKKAAAFKGAAAQADKPADPFAMSLGGGGDNPLVADAKKKAAAAKTNFVTRKEK